MPKALSLNEIRSRAARFALEWKDSPGDERQDAQSFVRDLLAVYGVLGSKAALYEKRAQRTSTGRQGYIDALVPGLLVVEMKSAGKDLTVAESQALDYLDNLTKAEMPRWVLTSDFHRFRLLDLTPPQGVETDTVEFDLTELPANSDRLAFIAGYGTRQFGSVDEEAASIKAAQLMARLYEALEGSGYDDHEASVFLVRTLFALYADDAGVWERDLFYEFLETRTSEDGSDLGPQLTFLYQALAKPADRRQSNLDELLARFPYVNGAIFAEPLSIPAFDAKMRTLLLEACAFNWSDISPAIFGSLFQAVKDKKARRELGEHYTTETNILKLIGPMFLDDLRQSFADNQHDAKKLRALRKQMGQMRFLDPACGCGNFLVVAYREMRALDLAVLERLQELGDREATKAGGGLFFDDDLLGTEFVPVKLGSFHGIELEEWPARIAATALHLVEHQANQAMELALGQGPETLPLNKVETIHVGNALRTQWTSVVGPTEHLYVLGNPPFLGDVSRSQEQKDDLHAVWGRKDTGRLDYVTGWYAKSLELFRQSGYAGEFAFVSTNSIAQGEPVAALFGPIFNDAWHIKFAHRTFAWTSEAPGAAAVHCSIIGFSKKKPAKPQLFVYPNLRGEPVSIPVAKSINAYLVDGDEVLIATRRQPLASDLPPAAFGNKPSDGGHLVVGIDDYDQFMADPIAAKYLRPYWGATELLYSEPRWVLWMKDLDPTDLSKSTLLRERVEAVRKFRTSSKAASTRDWADRPYLFKQAAHRDVPHLIIPSVTSENRKYFPAAHAEPHVISSNLNYTAEDPDGLAFAVLSSSAFILWQKTVGGRLKSDMRFSNTVVWNTFPLPKLTDTQRQAIITGGQGALEARALRPERSLADHYNPLAMDPSLLKAHRALDKAVDAVFGLAGVVDDDARLSALFTSYTKLTEAEQLPVPKKGRKQVR